VSRVQTLRPHFLLLSSFHIPPSTIYGGGADAEYQLGKHNLFWQFSVDDGSIRIIVLSLAKQWDATQPNSTQQLSAVAFWFTSKVIPSTTFLHRICWPSSNSGRLTHSTSLFWTQNRCLPGRLSLVDLLPRTLEYVMVSESLDRDTLYEYSKSFWQARWEGMALALYWDQVHEYD
jgi:hypothetical protein